MQDQGSRKVRRGAVLGLLVATACATPCGTGGDLQAQASRGDGRAAYRLALQCENGTPEAAPDLQAAARWYTVAAADGVAAAQNNLGLLFYRGRGVAQSFADARQWFERAAAQGNRQAQANLGVLHLYGHGVPRDLARGRELLTQAATAGDARAQAILGSIHYEGFGVERDPSAAARWYLLAAAQGVATAQYRIGTMLLRGEVIAQAGVDADAVGVQWLERAAAQGHAAAQQDLALCLQRGRGVVANGTRARELLGRAADQGLVLAQQRLIGGLGDPAADVDAAAPGR